MNDPFTDALLHEIVAKRAPQLVAWLGQPHIGLSADNPEVRSIMDALFDEFVEIGLQPDYEPNPYGLKVDELMLEISMYMIRQEGIEPGTS